MCQVLLDISAQAGDFLVGKETRAAFGKTSLQSVAKTQFLDLRSPSCTEARKVIRWLPRTEPIGGGGETTTIFEPCFLPNVILDRGIRISTLPAGFCVAAIAIVVLPIFGLCTTYEARTKLNMKQENHAYTRVPIIVEALFERASRATFITRWHMGQRQASITTPVFLNGCTCYCFSPIHNCLQS